MTNSTQYHGNNMGSMKGLQLTETIYTGRPHPETLLKLTDLYVRKKKICCQASCYKYPPTVNYVCVCVSSSQSRPNPYPVSFQNVKFLVRLSRDHQWGSDDDTYLKEERVTDCGLLNRV